MGVFALATGALALDLAVEALRIGRFGAEGFRETTFFATLRLTAEDLAAPLDADLAVDLGALRAGALSDAERFTSGLGRAVLLANVRFFAEGVEEY